MFSQLIQLLALLPAVAMAAPAMEAKSASASIDERADTTCGVYICDGLNFDGNCYYARYPWSTKIVPDVYFQQNGGSFGPDAGCDCFPSRTDGPECFESTDGKDITHNPGGNLGACINNFGSFYCNPA